MSLIEVKDITKNFRVYEHKPGFTNSIKSIFHREYINKCAIDHISFEIERGELVGYIGPNGAGKSTTIKILSGILVPSGGEVVVNGRIPYKNRKENALRIGVLFGQRSQLLWDLSVIDTFDLYRMMYKIPQDLYQKNLDYFIELLEMQEFLKRPARTLSLGQKMKANLAITMLHNPEILYLDEPTIGLDVITKDKMREFIREINKNHNTTVILTTHDMDDIEFICDRLIMIDNGKKLYDGALSQFKQRFSDDTYIEVEFAKGQEMRFDAGIQVVKSQGKKVWLSFDKKQIKTADVLQKLTQLGDIVDIKIESADIENIVRNMYSR